MAFEKLRTSLTRWLGRANAEPHPVRFDLKRGTIHLPRYAYPQAGARLLERAELVEIIDWWPPTILTKTGEFLFITAEKRDEVKAFCAATDIPFTSRYDLWSDLLEPYLDTVHSDDWLAKTEERMRDAGLSSAEITAIRARVGDEMLTLTAITWEWVHYGLSDVLLAMKPTLSTRNADWLAFYADAMEIARRGIAAPWPITSHLR